MKFTKRRSNELLATSAAVSLPAAAAGQSQSAIFTPVDIAQWTLDSQGNALVKMHDGSIQSLTYGTFKIIRGRLVPITSDDGSSMNVPVNDQPVNTGDLEELGVFELSQLITTEVDVDGTPKVMGVSIELLQQTGWYSVFGAGGVAGAVVASTGFFGAGESGSQGPTGATGPTGAAGSDGEDGGPTPPTPGPPGSPENQAPIFSSADTASVPENQISAGYTAVAEDPDGTLTTITRNVTSFSGTAIADRRGDPYYVGYEGTLSSGNSVWRIENKLDTTSTFQFHGQGNIYLKTIEVSTGTTAEVSTGTTALVPTPHTGLGHGVWVPYYPVGHGGWASGRPQGDEQAYEYTTEEVQVRTGVELTYSIVGGIDQSLFKIDSTLGALTLKSALDYEIPADNDANNLYEIEIEVSDGVGGTSMQSVTVAVTDTSEPAFFSPAASTKLR